MIRLRLGTKWNFFKPAPDEQARVRVADNILHLDARGVAPSSSSPLLLIASDLRYSFECDIEIAAGGTAGLLLFYNERLYCGLGFDEQRFVTHQYGIERARPANPHGRRMRMRVTNDAHIVTYETSGDGGRSWRRFDRGMEVSGYYHNVRGWFPHAAPRPLFCRIGRGQVQQLPFPRHVSAIPFRAGRLTTTLALSQTVPAGPRRTPVQA